MQVTSRSLDSAAPTGSSWMPQAFRPPLPAPPITDPDEIAAKYKYFRPRILIWTTIGYGMFYFVRKNLSIAMPLMNTQLGLGTDSLGLILTVHGVLYGVSKFLNGMLADRANARIFMASALIISAILNVCFGLSSALVFFGIFWMLNGWFQGMGYPPCARLLTHWFSPKELATKMSLWNASHVLGGGSIVVLCGYIIQFTDDWRLCFFVPAVLAVGTACFLLIHLRDTPESVGLPEIEGTAPVSAVAGVSEAEIEAKQTAAEFRQFLWRQVFCNPYIWLASAGNFFVYTIRFSIFDWGPFMLKKSKHIELTNATWIMFGFEVAGLGGMLLTGWLTDKYFRGRSAPLCVICMLLCGLSIFLFWLLPPDSPWLCTGLLMSAGFFVYGPQALVAVIVANLATKRAAATAVGLTSIFGYASTVLSGWGLGLLVKTYSWSVAFQCLIVVALCGAVLFAFVLPAKASGYDSHK